MIHQHSLLVFLAAAAASLTVPADAAKNAVHNNSADKIWDHYKVSWDESMDAFVPYPKEADSIIQRRHQLHSSSAILDFTDTIDDWDQPIMALIKGIVHRNRRVMARPHFFVQNGVTANCHADIADKFDFDTASNNNNNNNRHHRRQLQQQLTEEEDAARCARHCTNQGRYCLETTTTTITDPTGVPGSQLIQEAVRRMCFEVVTHDAGSTELFGYVEDFQQAACQDQGDKMMECADQVLGKGDDTPNNKDIRKCLDEAGGFENDDFNLALEDELEWQDEMMLPKTLKEAQPDLPVLLIDGRLYTSHYTVKDIFAAVCDSFPDNARPLSCDFCGTCQNVRKCLWQLTCDGEAFDATKYAAGGGTKNAADAMIDPQAGNSDDDNESSGWDDGLMWGLVGGLCIAAFFMVREMRSRRNNRRGNMRSLTDNINIHKEQEESESESESSLRDIRNSGPDPETFGDSLDAKHHCSGSLSAFNDFNGDDPFGDEEEPNIYNRRKIPMGLLS